MRKTALGHPAVLRWAAAQANDQLFLSVISLQELEYGALLLRRKDAAGGRALLDWVERQIVAGFGERLLPVDAATARACAALHVPRTRPQRDALIAATALVRGMTVVTRDIKDFVPMGVRTFNPWDFVPG